MVYPPAKEEHCARKRRRKPTGTMVTEMSTTDKPHHPDAPAIPGLGAKQVGMHTWTDESLKVIIEKSGNPAMVLAAKRVLYDRKVPINQKITLDTKPLL
jgi:hypothetical protein